MASAETTKAASISYFSDKHAQGILTQMNKMRIQCELCDVQLQLEKELFFVHRLVLASSSPYFAALLTGGMLEASKDVVQIEGVSADTFKLILDYIYTGVVNVNVNNVQEIIIAADMFHLCEIVDICCKFLKEQMDPSNCIGIFQFAEQISCHDLLEFAESYIFAHFLEVKEGEEFTALSKEQLIKILKSEELRIEDEDQVFTAAMQWILKDLVKRRKHVVDVLSPVRFALVSPQSMLKYIEGIQDFGLQVALQALLRKYTSETSKTPREGNYLSFLQTSKVCPRKRARKYLYAVGGYTRLQGGRWNDSRALSCVERFDTFTLYWTTVASLHDARSGLGMAVLEGMIYVTGGEKESMIFSGTERYDPVTKQWTEMAFMNYSRCGHSVCACRGALYALGGWIGAQIGNTIERFDPSENKWELVGQMAVPRYYFGCCEQQGVIYIIGGINSAGIELRSAEGYDTIRKRWCALPVMSTRRAYLGVAILGDYMYAVGGWNEEDDALCTVEKYSFEEEEWLQVSPMKMPRAGVSVVTANGLLYAAGGRGSNSGFAAPVTTDSVEVYDPNTDTWSEIGNMITSRCEGGLVVL